VILDAQCGKVFTCIIGMTPSFVPAVAIRAPARNSIETSVVTREVMGGHRRDFRGRRTPLARHSRDIHR
jgi:hypothetical protein